MAVVVSRSCGIMDRDCTVSWALWVAVLRQCMVPVVFLLGGGIGVCTCCNFVHCGMRMRGFWGCVVEDCVLVGPIGLGVLFWARMVVATSGGSSHVCTPV